MREYTAVEVEGIARNELRSDLEKLLLEGARQMLEVALQTEVAEYTEFVLLRDCGGRMKIIAALTDPSSIRRCLHGMGLPARAPPIAPARPDPQPQFDYA